MSLITWACLRCVQELTTILGPQNRTQGSCEMHDVTRALRTCGFKVSDIVSVKFVGTISQKVSLFATASLSAVLRG